MFGFDVRVGGGLLADGRPRGASRARRRVTLGGGLLVCCGFAGLGCCGFVERAGGRFEWLGRGVRELGLCVLYGVRLGGF